MFVSLLTYLLTYSMLQQLSLAIAALELLQSAILLVDRSSPYRVIDQTSILNIACSWPSEVHTTVTFYCREMWYFRHAIAISCMRIAFISLLLKKPASKV